MIKWLVFLLSAFYISTAVSETIESCDSEIYCKGELLETIQTAKIFDDSKYFVDLSLKNSPEETLEAFNNLMKNTSNQPSKEQLRAFVDANFEEAGELENWTPPDFKPDPEFLSKIDDVEVREFASALVQIWPNLARKVKDTVYQNPEKHSLLPLPNGFIIPGGRFKEIYYWDSYWIVKGLLLSEMTDTVKGIVENFLDLVQKYGFIPNGSRVYYLNRSQPPMLTLMAGDYFEATKNMGWLRKNIDTLQKELKYWLHNKTIVIEVNRVKHRVAHYISLSNTPRPESYIEDVETCAYWTKEEQKQSCYKELKSGAESGWDFSTRWFPDVNTTNLTHIETTNVIPVDLNSILYKAFSKLSQLYNRLGRLGESAFWALQASYIRQAIDELFYDKDDGIWYDFDAKLLKRRKIFYPSNFAPLWVGAYKGKEAKIYGKKAAIYFKINGIDKYPGGIPTSVIRSGEQWDLPNAWPPLQDIVVTGLYDSGDCEAKSLALKLAKLWVQSNMIGYDRTKEMFEKYDAETPGAYGGGGEYVVQSGFGWTNGVILSFINSYYS